VGNVEKRVVVLENNAIAVRDMVTLSLVCDHRAVDGTYGARFLQDVKGHLENFTV
jgi:pyruvate dehydrogenase E2 component (dihydrolipoamide acetyltransferase)